jgi:hypothetical protein
MELDNKVMAALTLIDGVLQKHPNPVVYSSFGKDSMVLLDLVGRAGFKLPIVFHRLPFMPWKYRFAEGIIQERGYAVYDYPPMLSAVNEGMEIINYYSVGTKLLYTSVTPVPVDPGKAFLCGYMDVFERPKGYMDFPWDLIFIGHKDSDIDPVLGPVPLKTNYVERIGEPSLVFPLRDFTDQDIWDYTTTRNIPVHDTRYDRDNSWKKFKDTTFNPDFFPVCTACMDHKNDSVVHCPKFDKDVPNISPMLRRVTDPLGPLDYLKEIEEKEPVHGD